MSKYWSELDEIDYKFVSVPKALFTNFKDVSVQAKWVYSILLDRLMVSRKNVDRFSDEEGLFLYFRQEELAEILGVTKRSVITIFNELKKKGLIETRTSGLGKPKKIYVAKLSSMVRGEENFTTEVKKTSPRTGRKLHPRSEENFTPEVKKTSPHIESNTNMSKTKESNTEFTFRATPKNESRFKPPTVDEVQAYIAEKGFTFSAEEFVASNEQKGWVVGRNQTPMKNWKAACTIWQKNQQRFSARDKPTPSGEDLNKKWGILNYDEYLEKEKENGRKDTADNETFGASFSDGGFGMFGP